MTELRVHGVGGTPPEGTLGDLAPEQATGDSIAGFYRTADHRASMLDAIKRRDITRHVEVYSWGGLTSRAKSRVLWLVLLPFLLGNLAGWMCSVTTRKSTWRFRLHRLAAGLGALGLTVNAVLIAVMISADVLAYQTARAGLAQNQWWLAPLGWHFIVDHPARQLILGVLVPVLFVMALVGLAIRSWRYEAVPPPYQVGKTHKAKARAVTAAVLGSGLADDEFWDGERSVRLITWLHTAVAGGFLAIVLGATAKATTGPPHTAALWWIAMILGGATAATGIAYTCLDALSTPPVESLPDAKQAFGGVASRLRNRLVFLLVPAAAALVSAGAFAWLQPGTSAREPADLPGMASVTRWTALAIAVTVAAVLISMLLGLPRQGRPSSRTLTGGPWIILMLGFSLLNTVMLSAETWVAHLVGPVTSDAAGALSRPKGKIYLPHLVTAGIPLLVWAAMLAVAVFGLAEAIRWLLKRKLPADTVKNYKKRAKGFRKPLATGPLGEWFWSGLKPFPPPGNKTGDPGAGKNWERQVARTQLLAGMPHDAPWLLWGIVVAQLGAAVSVWQFSLQPPAVIRNVGVVIAGLALPLLMGFLSSAWNDPARRRTIGVLWDVGTFWPRSYHPFSPPAYTERAIPELQRRMWWLHDNGGRVVLVAHSQGAMLATAALVQPGCRPHDDWPALITFGSPVCKLYSWGFPAYVNPELLTPLARGGQARLSQWLNFFYPTDPIGGPVAPDLPPADGILVDRPLPDPAECWYAYGQEPPSAKGHSGYWADARVWDLINQTAAGKGWNAQAKGSKSRRPPRMSALTHHRQRLQRHMRI